jgi:hypothetical protein
VSEILMKDLETASYVMKQCFTGFARVEKKSRKFDLITRYEKAFEGYMDFGPLFSYDEEHPGKFEEILEQSLQENKPYPEYLPESKLTTRPDWLPKHILRKK